MGPDATVESDHAYPDRIGPRSRMRSSSRLLWRVERRKMTRTELIVQLLKIAIGLVFGAYFVWWSLQVLDRLTPEYDAPTAVRIMKDRRRAVDLAFGQHEDRTPTHGYAATREAAMAAFAKSWWRGQF